MKGDELVQQEIVDTSGTGEPVEIDDTTWTENVLAARPTITAMLPTA